MPPIQRNQGGVKYLCTSKGALVDTHIKEGFGVQSDQPQLFKLVKKLNDEWKQERSSEDLHNEGSIQLILRSTTGSKIVACKSVRKGLIKEQLSRELYDKRASNARLFS